MLRLVAQILSQAVPLSRATALFPEGLLDVMREAVLSYTHITLLGDVVATFLPYVRSLDPGSCRLHESLSRSLAALSSLFSLLNGAREGHPDSASHLALIADALQVAHLVDDDTARLLVAAAFGAIGGARAEDQEEAQVLTVKLLTHASSIVKDTSYDRLFADQFLPSKSLFLVNADILHAVIFWGVSDPQTPSVQAKAKRLLSVLLAEDTLAANRKLKEIAEILLVVLFAHLDDQVLKSW